MKLVVRLVAVLVIAFVVVFAIQNAQAITQTVDLRLNIPGATPRTWTLAVYELVIIALLAGLWIGGGFDLWLRGRASARLRAKNQTIKGLERELQSLRNLAIVDGGGDKALPEAAAAARAVAKR
ncbi:MAG: hypothetical protein KC466_04825 [Myxococcales bacterium]|nr:hypothetical protein [Myxococcales bacterium]